MPIAVSLDGGDVVASVPAGTLDETSALKEFAEKDWPRLEKTFTPEFITRIRGYLHRAGEM